MAEIQNPLDAILTPQLLAQKRKMEQMKLFQQLTADGNGTNQGMSAAGFALGGLLGKLPFGKKTPDPEEMLAQQNQEALGRADKAAFGISDPFEKQITQYTVLAQEMTHSGQYEIAGNLIDKANELRKQQQELGKLSAERRSAESKANADTNPDFGLGMQAQVETAGKVLGLQERGLDIGKKSGETVNYWRYRVPNDPTSGIIRKNIDVQDSLDRRGLQQAGWIEGNGPMTEAEAGAGLTKPTETNLQQAITDSDNQLDGMLRVGEKYDPKFSELPTQLLQKGAGAAEWLGIPLPESTKATLQQYTDWRQNSSDMFNRYIKYITGAQMSIKEADRIQQGFPNAASDSPSMFQTKFRQTVRQMLGVRKRAEEALAKGQQPFGNDWEEIPLPTVTDQETDQFLSTRMGWKNLVPGTGKTETPREMLERLARKTK